ncbi:hypothetical protein [Salinimonas lutimaris]|uniref:hypothetical protein n=1 Tax=Salinimonas lutimaris TaxID=914153 RepID=UPI0010BFD80B|nr:hypothetical protein [Salinimonas lutimaris]
MSQPENIEIVKLNKQQILDADVFSGISPKSMRQVFGSWIIFVVIVAMLVIFAPEMSMSFIWSTLAVLALFTVAMFAQSRISEGWPAVLALEEKLLVVRDPFKREFFKVNPALVTQAEPTVIKPNKKAIAVHLDPQQLSDADKDVLSQAVWPRDDQLLALAHFISRERACEKIHTFVKSAQ